ncbi:selenide, water dikinase SelD [Iningainema tapete]|uniref:Selenide, water dikinase n=1 Tax=Iningainema tapete BLCC-T55 TaxID=2748662 RepID=A0A8J6XTE0_9CYAN|nr:selenide, water dikinase SelD [Iningainema tapete]MBD2778871.1 selenide, water dikinase SelD [Iningainema tapete BLCC-T55]
MIRLTQYSHGGGCGCKIAPAQLQEILRQVPLNQGLEQLLVGTQTSDDAAVYQLNDRQALVLTTDFFMPIVDEPIDFGRIAATNALSDVYAMGGTPILALAVLGMPINTLPMEAIQGIMLGGAKVCQEAGIPLAGGHSIDSPEPIFGLVAAGLVHPTHVRRNATAKPHDLLILTKPLGIGVMTTALKKGKLTPDGYSSVLKVMTQLNKVGATLATNPDVHAMTDVTGFGLLGHLLEICRGSSLKAKISLSQIPILPEAKALADMGIFPGAAQRNWDSYQSQIKSTGLSNLAKWEMLLADPQTSGGLLLAVAPESTPAILEQLLALGYSFSSVIGEFTLGEAEIEVIT